MKIQKQTKTQYVLTQEQETAIIDYTQGKLSPIELAKVFDASQQQAQYLLAKILCQWIQDGTINYSAK